VFTFTTTLLSQTNKTDKQIHTHIHTHTHTHQTVVLEQELPLSDLLGIAVGHLYHYASTQKIIGPPQFLRNIFAQEKIRKLYRKFEDELH
jgi:hypothetical protein